MNTVLVMLVSIVVGAVAGGTAAMVVIEVKTEGMNEVIDSVRKNVENLAEITHLQNETAQSTTKITMGINTALQEFIAKYKSDRTWLMQSLNDLWKDYDERHPKASAEEEKVEVKPLDEKNAAPKRTRKRKQAKEEVKTDDAK